MSDRDFIEPEEEQHPQIERRSHQRAQSQMEQARQGFEGFEDYITPSKAKLTGNAHIPQYVAAKQVMAHKDWLYMIDAAGDLHARHLLCDGQPEGNWVRIRLPEVSE